MARSASAPRNRGRRYDCSRSLRRPTRRVRDSACARSPDMPCWAASALLLLNAPVEPAAGGGEKAISRVLLDPGAMTALLELVILELRQIRLQGVANHRARMRIIGPVQHQDRAIDGGKAGRNCT